MNTSQLDRVFDQIDNSGEYDCKKTSESNDLIVYTIETDIKIVEQYHNLIIDVNLYIRENTAVFVMNTSPGYFGANSHRMDRLLMEINSVTLGGHFGYWYKNGDIVFRKDLSIDYLDYDRVLQTLRFFERVYVGVRPKLESYASEWELDHITEEEQQQLTNELAWFFNGIRRTLIEG
ncbi:MAG: hypothetical protein IPP13_03750 [Kouleothrix sp.]|jgi:hypothetical protein|nr:hypothetical protein [Kouleothrix sp.]